jgi:gentisate 1,2-dioxygenase
VAGALDHTLDQIVCAPRAIVLHHGIEGLEPLLSLDCVDVGHCEAD